MATSPALGATDGHVLSTPTGRDLLALFDTLTKTRPWRISGRPYPVIVLEAADPQARIGEYLDALERAADDAGIPHIRPALDDVDPGPLDTMSEHSGWNAIRPQYGRFRFPRSDFVKSLDQAVAAAPAADAHTPAHRSAAAFREWNEAAVLFPWSRAPFKAPVWWSTIGVTIAAVLVALFGGVAQGLADKTRESVLLTVSGVLMAVVVLVAGLMTRRIWLPILSRVGFGTRYRWFAVSSFFAVLGGSGFDARLQRVFDRLVAADAEEFRLQLKTFAFLEDIRAAHRNLSPTLRGFKRPVMPVVFLDGITAGNGGIELLSAMSDIRSRRSELHPLLLIATTDFSNRGDLDALAEPQPPEAFQVLYDDWEASLGTAQAPSQMVAVPWLLRLPIPHETAGRRAPAALTVRRRPRWTWLWSRRSLLAAVVVVAVGGSYLHARLSSTYCQVGFPFSANTETRLKTDTAGTRECVGVSTGGAHFERGALSVGLDGNLYRPAAGDQAGRLTLADLQNVIDAENASVAHYRGPHVTVLYAGMLTAAHGDEQNTVSSIRELAGAYLAQLANNHSDQPGEVGYPLKVRLLAVNDGENMAFSKDATDRVLSIARHDPTVVGVIGMGRNNVASEAAITRLSDAGMAVINTVNSSDRLPVLSHYYALASTDHDEAVVAAYAAREAFGGRPVNRAMIVSRDPGPSQDEYSSELTTDAQQTLRPRSPTPIVYTGSDDIAGKVTAACQSAAGDPYQLVYFAGRAEDLPGLITGLTRGGCSNHRLTLLGGDEVSRSSFGGGPHQILLPSALTVYYTTFVDLNNLVAGDRDKSNAFFLLARNNLGIGPAQWPLLTDGQMALTYDAASALAQAAQKAYSTLGLPGSPRDPGSAEVTSGSVLLELPLLRQSQGATGTIDFTSDDHTLNGPGNRGLTLVKVSMVNGSPDYRPICGRLNGGLKVADLEPCP